MIPTTVRSVPRVIYPFTHKEVAAAIRAYLERRGSQIKAGMSYVHGINKNDESMPVLELIVDKMPTSVCTPCAMSGTVKEVRKEDMSQRAPDGMQRFELSPQAVIKALSDYYIEQTGGTIPNGPTQLGGLSDILGCGTALAFVVEPIQPS